MSYNPFIKLEQSKVDRIPWITGSYRYYFPGTSKKEIRIGNVYSVTLDTAVKLLEKLEGADTTAIKAKDKVFLMPGSKIPLFKLKDHLKKVGASHVSDIDKATFFIGTSKTCGQAHYGRIRPSQLLFSGLNLHVITDIDALIEYYDDHKFIETLSSESSPKYNDYVASRDYYYTDW